MDRAALEINSFEILSGEIAETNLQMAVFERKRIDGDILFQSMIVIAGGDKRRIGRMITMPRGPD